MNREEIETRLKQVIWQENAYGWDKPHKFLMLLNSGGTSFIVPTEVDANEYGHPMQYLNAMYKQGMKFPDTVEAIGFCFEGWRHLDFEEAIKTETHMLREMWDLAHSPEFRAVAPDPEDGQGYDEAIKKWMSEAWYEAMRALPPGTMTPENRHETRNCTMEFRNKDVVFASHIRGREEIDVYWNNADETRVDGRVSIALRNFLNGENPDPDGDFVD